MADAGVGVEAEARNGTWTAEIDNQSLDNIFKLESIDRLCKTESTTSKGKAFDINENDLRSQKLENETESQADADPLPGHGDEMCHNNMEPYDTAASEMDEDYESSLPDNNSEQKCPDETEEGEKPAMGDPNNAPELKAEEPKSHTGDQSQTEEVAAQSRPEDDYGVALWVKWRGRWQPCIQCDMDDWSTATAKNMPTYKKTYIVVFFPNTRSYSWVDLQNVCHISDKPLPLAYGTHLSGRESVKDVNLPRSHMLRSLAASVLDISDRMPIKAVVESAQNVEAWRAFAAEAGQAKQYSDVGKLLVRLFEMIVRTYLKKSWLGTSFITWHDNCFQAKNAQSVEALNHELVSAILWDEVSLLWDAPEQSNLGPEWKNWKGPLFEKRDAVTSAKNQLSPTSSIGEVSEVKNEGCDMSSKRRRQPFSRHRWPFETFELGNAEVSRKRSKLEVRRRGSFLSSPSVATSSEMKHIEKGSECIDSEEKTHVEANSASLGMGNMVGLPSDLRSPAASKDPVVHDIGLDIREDGNTLDASDKKTSVDSQHCAAYLEKKQRHCIRFRNQGSRYCSKHIYIESDGDYKTFISPDGEGRNENSGDLDAPSTSEKVEGPICEGMTRHGRRCMHRAKIGSLFCKKHNMDDAPHLKKENEDTDLKVSEEMADNKQIHLVADGEPKDFISPNRDDKNGISVDMDIPSTSEKPDGPICEGMTKHGRRCMHRAKVGSLFCKKHTIDDAPHLKKEHASTTDVICSEELASTNHMKIEADKDHKDVLSPDRDDRNGNSGDVPSTLEKIEGPICEGMTKHGRRCTHRAKIGSLFCKKHTIDDAPHLKKEYNSTTDIAVSEELTATKHVHVETNGDHKDFISPDRDDRNGNSVDMDIPSTLETNGPVCEGMTKYGRRCTHRAKMGSLFCKKHTIDDAPHLKKENSSTTDVLSSEEVAVSLEMEKSNSLRKRKSISTISDRGNDMLPQQPRWWGSLMKNNDDRPICIGRRVDGAQCSHRAKPGSYYCEKHVPNVVSSREYSHGQTNEFTRKRVTSETKANEWLNRYLKTANHNDNRPRCIGRRVDGAQCSHRAKPGSYHCEKHVPDVTSFRDYGDGQAVESAHKKACEAKANEWFNKYLENANQATFENANDLHENLLNWIINEASKDLSAAESLLKIVTEQKEKLGEVIKIRDEDKDVLLRISERLASPTAPANIFPEEDWLRAAMQIEDERNAYFDKAVEMFEDDSEKLRCSVCSEDFTETFELGLHWTSHHSKEARWFLKGYACKICNLDFTNEAAIERHWKGQHEDLAENPGLATCLSCDKQFTDFKVLWDHVALDHLDHLASETAAPASVAMVKNVKVPKKEEILKPSSKLADDLTALTVSQAVSAPVVAHDIPACDATPIVLNEIAIPTFAPDAAGSAFRHDENLAALSGDATETAILDDATAAAVPHDVAIDAASRDVTISELSAKKEIADFKVPAEPCNSALKYRCRFCGQRFKLLPDLGRHHQAEHMLEASSSTKGIGRNLYSRKRRPDKPWRLGNDMIRSIKESMQNAQQQDQDYERETSKDESSQSCITLTSNACVMPSNDDISAAACTACCEAQLYNILETKYGALPEEFSVVAMNFVKKNLSLQWACEGYACPEGCKISSSEKSQPSFVLSGISGVINWPKKQEGARDSYTNSLGTSFASKKLKHVLCADISFGQETLPIPCVMDDEAMQPCACAQCKEGEINEAESLKPWESFKYITRRLLDPLLGLDMKNSQLGCSCETARCSPETCDHVYLFDNDNSDALDVYGKQMHGRFSYDENGRIVLQEGYLVYECNSSCHCEEECQNRILQRGVRVKLEVFKTRHKGWAVRTAEAIPRGTFVCEYLGEVLNDVDANKRGERYDQVGCSYLYDIDVHLDGRSRGDAKPFVVDATHFGNVSRFINHSCAPNLINYQVLVESMDCQLAHIGLYASTDIAMGEELAYDYRYKLLPGRGCPCHCAAPTCRGRLY